MSLLDGIHEEAADLLKDKNISPKAIRLLKKVTGIRQIEIAELIVSANNFSSSYADALVLGTPKEELTTRISRRRRRASRRKKLRAWKRRWNHSNVI